MDDDPLSFKILLPSHWTLHSSHGSNNVNKQSNNDNQLALSHNYKCPFYGIPEHRKSHVMAPDRPWYAINGVPS
jgi:hypothetical protein